MLADGLLKAALEIVGADGLNGVVDGQFDDEWRLSWRLCPRVPADRIDTALRAMPATSLMTSAGRSEPSDLKAPLRMVKSWPPAPVISSAVPA